MTSVVNLRDFQVVRADGRKGRVRALPDDMVRIDRPTRWGNPFRIGDADPEWCGRSVKLTPEGLQSGTLDRSGVLYHFRFYAIDRLTREPDWLEPLRGKRLACWCAPLWCHGDVIVELLR
jgi:hypothetical protein